MSSSSAKTVPPQAFISSYAPRIRSYANALLAPVAPPVQQVTNSRATKRGATAVNYAEDGEEEEFEDSEGPRRPTGLRSLRIQEQNVDRAPQVSQLGRELVAPINLQGIWREWMGKPPKMITQKQLHTQSVLPLTLIPIRIDLDIAAFRPDAPLPTPANAREFGIDESLPAYRQPEATPTFRLHDAFLWNLHEALVTPDQFAKKFVDELDFPSDRKQALIVQMTTQIRTQLEDYAGIALHPLFHSATPGTAQNSKPIAPAASVAPSQPQTPLLPATITALSSSNGPAQAKGSDSPAPQTEIVSATAEPFPTSTPDDLHNPDDTYRCIVHLQVNLLNKLFSDKFEWSLLHPPGLAEEFASQTCADFGLGGEWVSVISHAIYEAVLRMKKEVCENSGLLLGYGDIANDAAQGAEAGWRYEPDHLAEEWEPKLENLSKDEIEKREENRERQLRRVRRETARYTSTSNVGPPAAQSQVDIFADQDQPMGRGERSKKKRRFRSLSPLGRDTPDAGYGGGAALRDDERQYWRCSHCLVWGAVVWAVRDGPSGQRTLCHNCGFLYERNKLLPPWSKDYFANEHYQGSSRR